MSLLYFRAKFPIDNPEKVEIESNIKPEMYGEVLTDYLQTQIGTGKDDSPTNEQEVYHIELQLDLETDTFYIKSDTGNKGLTTGILMHILQQLPPGGE